MNKNIILLLLVIFSLLIFNHLKFEEKKIRYPEVKIFAAASMGSVIDDLSKEIQEKLNIKIVSNLGASSILAKQIKLGAICDIVITADKLWMNYLKKNNLIEEKTVVDFLSNSLVFIAHTENEFFKSKDTFLAMCPDFKLAIADPSHVPAGRYAKKALRELKIWNKMKKTIILAPDSKSVLAWVENKEASIGIVYATDVMFSKKIKIIFNADDKMNQRIKYLIAICKNKNTGNAKKVYSEIINNEKIMALFKNKGFNVLK